MTSERWQQLKQILHLALECEPAQRGEFLAEACANDEPMRCEVEAILAAHEKAGSFLETPVLEVPVQVPMALAAGTRLASHEIVALIGAGGMGEVYRARDTRLGRDVAIKVLPSAFTGDPDRLARFEREARVLATLNHPHIGAIYGIEDAPAGAGIPIRALVLELVEGETLAERIAGPPFRLDEALTIARQIADALEAAHEKGIVHRDLKPANIKITPDGIVKVLDFGLAKAASGDGPRTTLSAPPTATTGATRRGLIMGTAAYMSPEQARGGPVDKRTDIWAFGCVLYEMLSGRAAFARETVTDTLAAIVEREPDWTELPATAPPALRRLLRRCLEKDPKRRLRDIGDARFELEQLADSPAEIASTPERAGRPRNRTWAVMAVSTIPLMLALMLWLWWSGSASTGDRRVSRFTVDLPQDQVIVPGFNPLLALSPDGTQLAFTPLPGPVYIRRLDSLENRPLEVSTGLGFRGAPVFSPDSASIAFMEGNAIFSLSRPFLKAALSGGAAVKLADYDSFFSGDWGTDRKLYWTGSYPGGIVRIADAGGEIESVTNLDAEHGERSHRFAHLLPGGRALIYTVAFDGISSYDDARIDLWDLNTRQKKTLITGGTAAAYSPSGHIVYARGGKLFAVPFDIERLEVTGSPFDVLDGVMMSRNTGAANFSFSARGDLAYVPGSAEDGNRTLVWVDRSGKAEPLPLPPASYLFPRLSPDGRSLALEIEGPNHDIYFYDFARAVLSKVTTDGKSHNPVWMTDGKTVAFGSWQSGGMTIWSMPADRSGNAVRLDPAGTRQSPVSFSPDGKFLAFDQKDPQTQDDAWILPIGGTGVAQPVARSRFGKGSAKFSPDGRWIAYSSNESGRAEIYVQPFPGPGPKLQISNAGGIDPVWRRSGGELYYRSGNKMMVVSVTTSPEFQASLPKQLWEGNYSAGSGASCGLPGVSSSNYDVTPDGQRFLMVRNDDSMFAASRIVVVLNWAEELKEKARTQSRGK